MSRLNKRTSKTPSTGFGNISNSLKRLNKRDCKGNLGFRWPEECLLRAYLLLAVLKESTVEALLPWRTWAFG